MSLKPDNLDRAVNLSQRYQRIEERLLLLETQGPSTSTPARDHRAGDEASSIPASASPGDTSAAGGTGGIDRIGGIGATGGTVGAGSVGGTGGTGGAGGTLLPATASCCSSADELPACTEVTTSASPVQQRLEAELLSRGIQRFRFTRVPSDYYDQDLDYRKQCLQAHSVAQLAKSIVMENTRAHASVNGTQDPNNSKYYVVIVQYCARLNAEKLKAHIHALSQGRIGKQWFNMRLAPEDVSDQLSGFQHNAVSPVGMAQRVPIILSHHLTELPERCFWMGGGEVDLKLCLGVDDFLQQYRPFVMDCTF